MIRAAVALIACSISITQAQPSARGTEEESGVRQSAMQAIVDRANATYLTDDERAMFAVEHGVWTDEHLGDPSHMAKAALIVGAYDHPALMNNDANPLDHARGALMRGQPIAALALLENQSTSSPLRRFALRARCFSMLGQIKNAILELEQLEMALETSSINDATELSFGVHGLMHLYTIRPIDANAKTVYTQLNTLIAHGRDTLDQLNPEIRMVEAELLYEHHNRKAAREAAIEVLKRNPKHALATFLVGKIAIDFFSLDEAEMIADRLDLIANFDADDPVPSVLGAQIRARIFLRQRDPIGAERAIDPVLARLPTQRELLALEAAAAAAGFRESSTERLLQAYDELSPNQPDAILLVGLILSEARQYEQAERMLRRAIDLAPYWGTPRLQLGLMLIQSADDTGAKATLEAAIELDPFNLRAQNSLTLVRELMGYETIETEHFIIRFKGGIDRVLAEEMPIKLEQIYARVTGNTPGGTDHEPSVKTRIEIMPTHEFFSVRITGMPSIHTMAASTGPIIAMESPRDSSSAFIGPYDWARVFQHEFTHSANLSRTHNRIIHWMTEANAVYNEDSPRDSRTWTMLLNAFNNDRLFDLEEINEAFVRPKRKGDRSLAYAQGAWMYRFIIEEFGPRKPLEIMDASASGRSPTEAFVESLGIAPDEFMNEFLAWAENILLANGLLLPKDSPFPPISEMLNSDPDNPTPPTKSEIDSLLEQHPAHPQLLRIKFAHMLTSPNPRLDPETIEQVLRFIETSPTDETPHRLLAKHFLASDNHDQRRNAVVHLEYLDAREVHSSAYANQLALLYAHDNKHDLAIAKSLVAIGRSPFNPRYREQGARFALLAGNFELAAHHIEALTKIEPDQSIHTKRLNAIRAKLSKPSDD
ncbi:MAG: hypothetical protein JKY96_08455 [Phycisphaerales bacterium]|nr:hypothetical protein [Phycisphaerales bacterium]